MNSQGQNLVRAVKGPIILITVGVLFTIERFAHIGFSTTRPVLLIVVGALNLFGGRRQPRVFEAPYTPPYNAQQYPPQPPPPPAPGERR